MNLKRAVEPTVCAETVEMGVAASEVQFTHWVTRPLRHPPIGIGASPALYPKVFRNKPHSVIFLGELSEREPFAQHLEFRITIPHQLMPRFPVPGPAQESPNTRHEAYRVTQGRWRFQLFFLA